MSLRLKMLLTSLYMFFFLFSDINQTQSSNFTIFNALFVQGFQFFVTLMKINPLSRGLIYHIKRKEREKNHLIIEYYFYSLGIF